MRFLLQSLQDLDDSLRQRGSRLFVPQGKPLEVLPSLCQEWGITDVFFEKDTEPYALRRDENVSRVIKQWFEYFDESMRYQTGQVFLHQSFSYCAFVQWSYTLRYGPVRGSRTLDM
eukprot:gb/GECG01001966.1/.p1 GENE.gb/GECG01001966.1/~~gb/GECG01001966.1/.p1  ORF type:complete len:116 (+),score=8.74 gb/GECG01001966.1/:1-348(+)